MASLQCTEASTQQVVAIHRQAHNALEAAGRYPLWAAGRPAAAHAGVRAAAACRGAPRTRCRCPRQSCRRRQRRWRRRGPTGPRSPAAAGCPAAGRCRRSPGRRAGRCRRRFGGTHPRCCPLCSAGRPKRTPRPASWTQVAEVAEREGCSDLERRSAASRTAAAAAAELTLTLTRGTAGLAPTARLLVEGVRLRGSQRRLGPLDLRRRHLQHGQQALLVSAPWQLLDGKAAQAIISAGMRQPTAPCRRSSAQQGSDLSE